MEDVIEQLTAEHRTLGGLLDLIEFEVEVFEKGGRPDYALVQKVLHYLLTYPNLVHHPLEDAIRDRLVSVAPDAVAGFGDLQAEHDQLAASVRRFNAALENVLFDPCLSRAWFPGLARGVLEAYRHHIALEEVLLFPAALRYLGSADRLAIEQARSGLEDPLTSGAIRDDEHELLMLKAKLSEDLVGHS